MSDSGAVLGAVIGNVERVILGKTQEIKLVLATWLAGGHVLLEDVPGTGKTILARALAGSVAAPFKRIQFTPDLLPSDVIGTTIYNSQTAKFHFQQGPVFTSILLADEINRATPRTQSALLEAMAEGQVTIEGRAFKLDPLFFVIATQNPVEHHGTFPLPEAQLDRFMVKLSLGYPGKALEMKMVRSQNEAHPIEGLKPVASAEQMLALRRAVPSVKVTDEVLGYASDVVESTRKASDLRLGASPRALLALVRAAQALALVEGRAYVKPMDIHQLAKPVLAHRLVASGEARLAGTAPGQILARLLSETRVPVGQT